MHDNDTLALKRIESMAFTKENLSSLSPASTQHRIDSNNLTTPPRRLSRDGKSPRNSGRFSFSGIKISERLSNSSELDESIANDMPSMDPEEGYDHVDISPIPMPKPSPALYKKTFPATMTPKSPSPEQKMAAMYPNKSKSPASSQDNLGVMSLTERFDALYVAEENQGSIISSSPSRSFLLTPNDRKSRRTSESIMAESFRSDATSKDNGSIESDDSTNDTDVENKVNHMMALYILLL